MAPAVSDAASGLRTNGTLVGWVPTNGPLVRTGLEVGLEIGAPESVEVVGEEEGFPFEVLVVEELGSDAYAYGTLHLGPDADVADGRMFIARVDARRPPSKGETIHLRIRESEEHVFHPDTGLRVGGGTAARTSV